MISGGGENYLFRIVGSDGEISIGWDKLVLKKNILKKAPGLSIDSFPLKMQESFKEQYYKQYPKVYQMEAPEEFVYKTPKDYKGDRYEHFVNFFDSIRNGTKVVEDATFGLRASGPTEAGNISYFEKKIVSWDPEKMVIIKS